jgi:hypothetical protein
MKKEETKKFRARIIGAIEGTPGKQKTFFTINPGAPLEGL